MDWRKYVVRGRGKYTKNLNDRGVGGAGGGPALAEVGEGQLTCGTALGVGAPCLGDQKAVRPLQTGPRSLVHAGRRGPLAAGDPALHARCPPSAWPAEKH